MPDDHAARVDWGFNPEYDFTRAFSDAPDPDDPPPVLSIVQALRGLPRTADTIVRLMSDRVVTAFAPATVSNVACGFDVLSCSMEEPGDTAWRRLLPVGAGVQIDDILNDGGRIPRQPEKNTASVAARALLEALGEKRGVALTITKGLPLASGLGGSAASAAAAVVAVNALVDGNASIDQLVAAALLGEGLGKAGAHPDNIAPSLCGGFVLVRHPNPPDIVRLPVPKGLTVVLVHPDIEIETAQARALLGTTVLLSDAVAAVGQPRRARGRPASQRLRADLAIARRLDCGAEAGAADSRPGVHQEGGDGCRRARLEHFRIRSVNFCAVPGSRNGRPRGACDDRGRHGGDRRQFADLRVVDFDARRPRHLILMSSFRFLFQ